MKFKVLQWNIWTEEDPKNVVKLIQELNPDIACFQEVIINYEGNSFVNVPEFLQSETEMELHFQEAQYWPVEKGKKYQGNCILSRYPFSEKSHFYVQNMKHSDFDNYSNEGRVLVVGKVRLGGKPVTVVTTHLSYTHRFEETEQKILEEVKLLSIIKGLPEPLLLAGDFNVPPDSKLIKKLNSQFVHLGPDFGEKTWTTKDFSYQGFEENELNWRLDYVFGTEDISLVDSRIIQTDHSDHLPILVEIELK